MNPDAGFASALAAFGATRYVRNGCNEQRDSPRCLMTTFGAVVALEEECFRLGWEAASALATSPARDEEA